jgi:ribosomal protein S9
MSRKYNYILSNGDNKKAKQMVMVQYKINDAIVINDIGLVKDFSDLYVSENIALDELLKITKHINHMDVNVRQFRALTDEQLKLWEQRIKNN